MAGNDVTITLTAKDGSSTVFKAVGRSAADMGKQVDAAGKTSEASLGRLSKAGAAAGAAFAALGGVLSLASHANAEAEASQARLTTAIENSGHTIEEYQSQLDAASKTALQLGFDDEDAADAIAKMTTATGDADKAISDLSIAEDIARARKIDLASATNIVIAAEQGRFGALKRMGIAIDENASKEEALDALRQQFAGSAEAYSETTAAGYDRLKNSAENALEAIGSHLGPVNQLLMVLPGLSAGFTGVGAAVGALAPEMTAAGAAAAALDLALGPVGIAAAALAAVGALALFIIKTKDADDAMLDTEASAKSLAQNLADMAQQGFTTGQLESIRGFEEAIQGMGRASNDTVPKLNDVNSQIAGIQAQLSGPYPLTIDPKDADAARAALEAQLATLESLRDQYNANILTNDQYLQVQQDISDIYAGANPLNFALVEQHLKDLTADMQSGGETADQYVQNVADLKAQEDTYGLSLDQITQKTLNADQASTTYFNTLGRGGKSLQVLGQQFTDIGDDSLHAATGIKAVDTATKSFVNTLSGAGRGQKVLGQQFTDIDTGGLNAANTALADHARLQNDVAAAAAKLHANLKEQLGGYYGLVDGITSAKDAQAAFKETQDGIISSQDQYTGQLSEYQQQLGYITDAETLLNQRKAEGQTLTAAQEDFLSRADAAQERLTGGTEDATIALGMQAEQYAENMRIGDEMNQAMGEQTSSTNTLTATLNNLIAALQGIPGYVNTYINADTSDLAAGVAGAQAMLSTIDGKTVTTYVNVEFGHVAPGALGYQHGGMIEHAQHGAALSGWAWVGEAGPELIKAPGAMVVPHTASVEATRGTGGGRPITIHGGVTVVANNPQEFINGMRSFAYAREHG